MAISRYVKDQSSFTLIELLVVVSIISILAVFVIMTLNPAELLKQGRDSQRVSDVDTINRALSLVQVDNTSASFGTASTTYISIPDPTATSTSQGNSCTGLGLPSLPTGWTYHCSATSTYRNTDGTGWIPVNFNALSFGAPLGVLPTDPTNTSSSGNYYTYTSGGSWQLTATPESSKVRTTQANQTTGAITMGTNLNLSPLFNPNGLVGYWKFDEGGGAVAGDSSGNGNAGTLVGGPGWTTGKVGNALGYTHGAGTYVSIPQVVTDGSFSASFWVQTTANENDGTDRGMLTKNNGNGPVDYGFNFSHRNATNYANFVVNGGTGVFATITTASAINDGNWKFLTGTYDSTTHTASLYLNGSIVGTNQNNSITSWANASRIITVGSYSNTAYNFTGTIDDVRIYNRVLSAAEIMALYNATK